MSTPAQKANLARIRDNQRRSRARRREYLQELEQRLRACELQGIEASAEVQAAARSVAQENKQLRELLNRHGIGDDYIAHYLQSGTVRPLESGRGQPFRTADPGTSAQSLQQLLLPRRPSGLDQTFSFPLPGQSIREDSIASAPTASSSVWESAQGTMTPYGHHRQIGVAPAVVAASAHPQYSSPALSGDAAGTTARQNSFSGPPPASMLNDPRQAIVTTPSMSVDGPPAMDYHFSMSPYDDAAARGCGPPGGGC
ncbi:Uncharacterized protein TCAP_05053 [Tolypocladium capitatum]|uniref:BZIP domain-containing protein n=1 Tax=Tolypocladium capitatum TaxID=45235 RepID=A0A2K3QBT1_9HYPO|nr:Uncharacterized protein TCAP_05053 [Tolypocladium capitatum]